MNDARRLRSGYSNLGRIAIPALPQPIILTDRDDGSEWALSFVTDPPAVDGNGYIMINSETVAIRKRDGARVYPAFEGPIFGQDGRYRLLIRGGYLGFEYLPLPTGIEDKDNAPIFARRNGSRVLRQIYLSTTTFLSIRTPAWTPDVFTEIL